VLFCGLLASRDKPLGTVSKDSLLSGVKRYTDDDDDRCLQEADDDDEYIYIYYELLVRFDNSDDNSDEVDSRGPRL
jgi:hypothetical protein